MIVTTDTEAWYYSFTPAGADARPFAPGDLTHVLIGSADMSTEDLIATVNAKFRKEDGTAYVAAVELDVTIDQAKAAMTAMNTADGQRYNLVTNNCLTTVKKGIRAAGIDDSHEIIPNRYLNDLIKDYDPGYGGSGGRYIHSPKYF